MCQPASVCQLAPLSLSLSRVFKSLSSGRVRIRQVDRRRERRKRQCSLYFFRMEPRRVIFLGNAPLSGLLPPGGAAAFSGSVLEEASLCFP
jgi:hypothetical protein